jgi:hypothetical protein
MSDIFTVIGYGNYIDSRINVKNRFNIKEKLLKNNYIVDDDQLNQLLDINDKCFIKQGDRIPNGWFYMYFIYKSYYIKECYYSGSNGLCPPEYDIKLHTITDEFTLRYIKSCGEKDIESLFSEDHVLNKRNVLFNKLEEMFISVQERLDKKEIECEQLYDENDRLKKEIKQVQINFKTFEDEIIRLNDIIKKL